MQIREFWSHVDRSPECWVWTGTKDAQGYGRLVITIDGRKEQLAHRVAWLLSRGDIAGPVTNYRGRSVVALDHICRNPGCVRPDHLDPCGQSENGKRQQWPATCPHGHLFTPENTQQRRNARGYMQRVCRTCNRESQRRYLAKRRAERAA